MNYTIHNLTTDEVKRARLRHIFTITAETERGYIVRVFRLPGGAEPVCLGQSKECVRPRTARRYATQLVRDALKGKSR